ncbi:MAG: hypothetical protein HGB08_03600 [Candidatus Moranbacteria bacterium]|nr:hypothetical protein [Candidatus Moranbacteria bacterium]
MDTIPDSRTAFSVLAFLFSLADYVVYIAYIIKSKDIRPTLSSWISWFVMDAAILAGIIAAGEMAWQIVACTLGSLCVIFAIWRKRTFVMNWTRLDFSCLGIVLLSALIWGISGNPNIGIVINIIAITIGTVPMFRNLWRDPNIEPLLPWALVAIGGVFGILAISAWNLASALAPVWFLALQIAAVILICRKFFKQCGQN